MEESIKSAFSPAFDSAVQGTPSHSRLLNVGIGPSLLRVLPSLPLPLESQEYGDSVDTATNSLQRAVIFSLLRAPQSVFLIFILGSLRFLFLGDPAFKLKWEVCWKVDRDRTAHVGDQFRLEDSCLFVCFWLSLPSYDHRLRLRLSIIDHPTSCSIPSVFSGQISNRPASTFSVRIRLSENRGCRSLAPFFSVLVHQS